jgi:DNA-binding winged helix-turn-helix (wHTH) protein
MTMPVAARFVRFGRFTLDLGTDRLLDDQTHVSVPPKALAILRVLVLNRDRAVTKDELLQTVWPNTVVEEANLSQQIFTLRKLFDDDPARPVFIATIPRLGYRFVADVSDPDPEEAVVQSRAAPTAGIEESRRIRRLVQVIAVSGAALAGWMISQRVEMPREQVAFDVALPAGITLAAARGLPGVSPDGKLLALVVESGPEQTPVIWVKPINRTEGRILLGTQGAVQAFWSWDSRRMGFFAGGRLQTIAVAGGPPRDLAGVEEPRGGAWLADGTIVYVPGPRTPLWRVLADGGTPTSLSMLDPARRDVSHRWPAPLPDGRRFAVLVWSGQVGGQGVFVGSSEGGALTRVSAVQSPARVLAGHLLFISRETLVAQRIDLGTLRLAGDPVAIAQPVGRGPADEAAFATSPTGALSFVRTRYDQRLQVFSGPDYQPMPLGDSAQYAEPAVSPDGTQVAFSARNREHGVDNMDVWVMELATRRRTRVTFDEAVDVVPVWSPDGRELLFRSNRSGGSNLYRKRLDAYQAETLVLDSPLRKDPTDWSSDGRTILFNLFTPAGGTDVWRLDLADTPSAKPVIAGPLNQSNARFSPDGRFVVFSSDENGTPEVLVQSLADGTRWRVGAGSDAYWRDDGRALFLVGLEGDVEVVAIRRTPGGFSFDRPVRLFAPDTFVGIRNGLAPARNGRFFIVTTVVRDPPQPASVVLNWRPEP